MLKSKMIQSIGVVSIVMLLLFVGTAFVSPVKMYSGGDDNRCVVYVKTNTGSPAAYVKVTTEVSGGISCIGGREFETDGKGRAVLLWSKGCKLKKVYAQGKGYCVDYEDGGSYTLTLD